MNADRRLALGLAITALLGNGVAVSQIQVARPVDPFANVATVAVAEPKVEAPRPHPDMAPLSNAESSVTATGAASSLSTPGVFGAAQTVSPLSTTLSPPLILNYAGSSPVISVGDTGTSKGIQVQINNATNSSSAIYGQTNGSGAGVTGYNSGTTGFAGKFGVTNSASTQPAVSASTAGKGTALTGTATNSAYTGPVILGQSNNGYGVEGTSNFAGVYGLSAAAYGIFGQTTSGIAVYAIANSGYGVYANSVSNFGVYGTSGSGSGVRGYSGSDYGVSGYTGSGKAGVFGDNAGNGYGVYGHGTTGGIGVYGISDGYVGTWGQSSNGYGVVGEDFGAGVGVYGYSATGYAGYFSGKLGANSFITLSDRNAKTNFKTIDRKEMLDRVVQLPITSWDFKTDLATRHVGPMAQDFHSLFGLNGADDTHINLTDLGGVSLAAIQELAKQMKAKDEQIAALSARIQQMSEALESRLAAIEAAHSNPSLTASAGEAPSSGR